MNYNLDANVGIKLLNCSLLSIISVVFISNLAKNDTFLPSDAVQIAVVRILAGNKKLHTSPPEFAYKFGK